MAGEDYLGLKPYSLKSTFMKPVITHFLKNPSLALLFQIQLILANKQTKVQNLILLLLSVRNQAKESHNARNHNLKKYLSVDEEILQ